MKKLLSWLVLLLMIIALIGPVTDSINIIKEQIDIEGSKPTQQQRLDFKSLLNDKTYYYYNNLNDSEKDAYITMYYSFMSFDDSFVMELDVDNLKPIKFFFIS